jgi:hypothetical protein
MDSFKKQSAEQGFEFKRWEGIIDQQMPFRGINNAHCQIVRDAKDKGLEMVCIAEDDAIFFNIGSWDYYVKNMPSEFSIFFGMIYEGTIDENNRIIVGLSGLTIYTVHESFYDIFLGLRETNHLDREIGFLCYKYKFMCCDKFVAYQSDGFSDNKKQDATYGHLLKGRKLFGINDQS